ncbi:Protein toll [Halotydeus destructor]|nr:Protein toll [Halotydeus destructor]
MVRKRHHWSPVARVAKSLITVILIVSAILFRTCSSSSGYSAPEDCTFEPDQVERSKVSLNCNLRTVNGAFESTNLQLIQSRDTVSLRLKCSDYMFDSSLSNGSFGHLKELRSLTIQDCRMSSLPSASFSGLPVLRTLSLRTRTLADISSEASSSSLASSNLAIPSTLFRTVRSLESVDLSCNGLTSLPDNLFCDLNSLRDLNLTFNAFSELFNIGFSTKVRKDNRCKVDNVQSLDISHNRIKVLTDRGFGTLPRLTALTISHNLVSRAEENALLGLSQLSTLDLSNNELVALPPRFFNPVSSTLTELKLNNNSISVLPPGLFLDLTSLIELDLSRNEITSHWINQNTFGHLTKLINMDLSNNKLSRVDSTTFSVNTNLNSLTLSHNEIEVISANAFRSLGQLETLVLSHNRLTTLDSSALLGPSNLIVLSLDDNRIEHVHPTTFANMSGRLMELTMKNNKLRSVPEAVGHLKGLRALDLSYNQIVDISNTSYQGLEHLYSLVLEANRIGNISRGYFRNLPQLRVLNLAHNEIKAIEQDTFKEVPDLHALRLDSNVLRDVNGLFTNLHDLLMLNISANRIAWFDYALIPIGLQWLDIHSNQIETLGNYFELETVLKLRTLDASSNRISELVSLSLPDGIELVYLNSNLIHRIAPFSFSSKANLTKVDLTGNKMASLDMNAFRLAKDRPRRTVPEFRVANNPYRCDCHMEWLLRLRSELDTLSPLDITKGQFPKFADAKDIECAVAFDGQQRGPAVVPLAEAVPANFLCPYKSHCFALCHCCEFDACDCEMTCPENCSCYYDQSWSTNIVDCSASRHLAVPPRIPMDATELYLDGNNIQVLSSHAFIGRKNLKVLHLNSSNIETINNRTFNGLRNLQVMNLNHNRLTALHGFEFERLIDLEELYLSYNRISIVANRTFAALRSLRVLHLDHNYIIEFDVWNINYNVQVRDLRLSSNMWSCECTFVQRLTEWLPRKAAILSDGPEVQCFYNETLGLPLMYNFNMSNCIVYSSKDHHRLSNMFGAQFHQINVQDLVPVMAIGGAIFALVCVLLIVGLVYRREMSVWFYSKYGVRLNSSKGGAREEEKLFDAFLSYSKKDEAFVSQILAPELEYGSPSFRLCLHYRDLPVATGYLADAIVEAMDASRRTLLVISENFLRGEWCRYEFKSAHLDVLRSTPAHRLILVFIGKIDPTDIDPDIRFWLKTQTYLQWGEKMFWDKLRYAMPDISAQSSHSKMAATATTGRKGQMLPTAPMLTLPMETTRDMTVGVHI